MRESEAGLRGGLLFSRPLNGAQSAYFFIVYLPMYRLDRWEEQRFLPANR